LTNAFSIHNGLKQEDALSKLLFNLALEYTIRKVKEYQSGKTVNEWTLKILIYADDANLLGVETNILKQNKELFRC
jgi:hypothetical protein